MTSRSTDEQAVREPEGNGDPLRRAPAAARAPEACQGSTLNASRSPISRSTVFSSASTPRIASGRTPPARSPPDSSWKPR